MRLDVKTTDILIVGGGGAGPWAALRAVEKDPAAGVALVTKGRLGRSGVRVGGPTS